MFTYRKPDISPTISFFTKIGKSNELKDLDLTNLDYETRLRLGLYLTDEEFHRNKLILKEKRIDYLTTKIFDDIF